MGSSLLVPILLMPLIGAIFSGFLALTNSHSEKGSNKGTIALISCLAPAISFVLALITFFNFANSKTEYISYKFFEWISSGNLQINFELFADQLTLTLVLVITFIGTLIHIYSIGYMNEDRGFARYFAYLNLFTFSMLTLVLGQNLIVMFLGWEGVGVCSYFLIGFWFTDREKAIAGNKAFITNRIGDFGLLMGIFLIFWTMSKQIGENGNFMPLDFLFLKNNIALISPEMATIIALLLFVGAMGKSAQIPLHVWLPDAMAGPTPVSALIHAATMVTAGIYMICRLNFLFSLSTTAMLVIAIIGTATAFFAATAAITQDDIKKVLAYSTVSQLGYMFMAVGIGAFSTAVFHLFTHAFFKALLFLGSGSVIHAMSGEQNIWKMGGLKTKLKITHLTFLIGTISIAGIPPFSGFFSKDEILAYTMANNYDPIFIFATITALLTSFYMFRLYFLVFWGDLRNKDEKVIDHIHESPKTMTLPLIILAIGSATVGFLGIPHMSIFEHWLEPVFHSSHIKLLAPPMDLDITVMITSTITALGSMYVAYLFYVKSPHRAERMANAYPMAYKISKNKWYFDEIYKHFLVKPLFVVSTILWKFFDNIIIDGLVNGTAKYYYTLSASLKDAQTGKAGYYIYYMGFGILSIFLYFLKITYY